MSYTENEYVEFLKWMIARCAQELAFTGIRKTVIPVSGNEDRDIPDGSTVVEFKFKKSEIESEFESEFEYYRILNKDETVLEGDEILKIVPDNATSAIEWEIFKSKSLVATAEAWFVVRRKCSIRILHREFKKGMIKPEKILG